MRIHSIPFFSRTVLVLLVSAAAIWLSACPSEDSETTESPTVFLNVRAPETVVMVASDRTEVELDLTTNNTMGRELPSGFTYQVSLDSRYDGTPNVPSSVAQFSVDTGVATAQRPRLAQLTITTDADVEPGVYDYRIAAEGDTHAGFTLNPPALMRLVIVPTGGSIKTARVSQVAAGLAHTLVVVDDGSVWAFGDNRQGQLGDGTLIDRSVPAQVQDFDGPVRTVAAGRNHSVALGENGRVYTWGANDRDQLGTAWRFEINSLCPDGHPNSDDRADTFFVPRFLITSLSAAGCDYNAHILEGVSAIAAGDYHTLALTRTGVVSFGRNDHGQLGDQLANDGTAFGKPVQGLFGRPLSIAAAGDFSLALDGDGTVWGWGDNALGQIGVGQHSDVLTPIDVAFTGEVQLLAPGRNFVVARRRGVSGFISWGANTFGQLGDGTTDSHDVPMLLATYLPITQLAAGDRHVVATLPDGTVYTWGDNGAEQLGGSTTNFRALTPLVVPRLTGMSGIAAGAFHSLTRHNSCGTLWSWGRNLQGQLGQAEVSVSQGQPLPIYGLGEASLGEGCEVGLRIWQRGAGTITTADNDFGASGCDLAYCGAPVARDRVVQVTATPADSFEFQRWVGDCTGVNPTVTLTIDESKDCIAVYGRVAAVDEPPVADIAYSPANPVAGEQVTFDGSGSSDDAAITGYEWDFDDDGAFEATGVMTTHTFPTEGLYTVHLRVTDGGGQTDVAMAEVTVDPSAGGSVTLTLSFLGGGSGRVISGVGGLDCTSTCTVDFAPGTEVFLSPMPLDGSVFSHWGTDLTDPPTSDCDQDFGIEGCALTMNGDRTVRVYFE